MYEYSEAARRWTRVETFGNIQEPVHDIAFAPNIGTSLYIITKLAAMCYPIPGSVHFSAFICQIYSKLTKIQQYPRPCTVYNLKCTKHRLCSQHRHERSHFYKTCSNLLSDTRLCTIVLLFIRYIVS